MSPNRVCTTGLAPGLPSLVGMGGRKGKWGLGEENRTNLNWPLSVQLPGASHLLHCSAPSERPWAHAGHVGLPVASGFPLALRGLVSTPAQAAEPLASHVEVTVFTHLCCAHCETCRTWPTRHKREEPTLLSQEAGIYSC